MFSRAALPATIAACLALAACGGSGTAARTAPTAATFRATLERFTTALTERDAPRACAQITPAFWQAIAGKLDATLSAAGRPPVPGGSCARGLSYVLARLPIRTAPPSASLHVEDLVPHGSAVSAIVANGSSREPARFARSASGRWQIDCCTGAQLDHLARVQYRVASVSMQPTFGIGQVVQVDNATLNTRPPRIGEIVTVHAPTGPTCPDPRQGDGFQQPCGAPQSAAGTGVEIKRVVGLPGDRIAIVGGHVVRDGAAAAEPYILACRGSLCDFPKPIVVPPGAYYVLGDNRGNSFDSRFYGPVRRAWIIGLVER